MIQVETAIKKSAEKNHGALYGEWAKKEECWIDLKNQEFGIDFNSIKADFEDPKNPSNRKRMVDEETLQVQIQEEIEKINSIPSKVWNLFEEWGRETGELSAQKRTVAFNLAAKARNGTKPSDFERQTGLIIIDHIIEKAPELLENILDLF